MAERRPASGEAPPRGETPSQAEQRLLVVGVCSWFCLPAPQAPNRLSGIFSWINPYRRQFFLIKCCHRVLSRIFSVIITSKSVLLGVYQEFLCQTSTGCSRSICLSSVRIQCAVFLPLLPGSRTLYSTTPHHPASPKLHFRDTALSSTPTSTARRLPVIKHEPLPCESCRWSPRTGL